MDFNGPLPGDYANVAALNRAYLIWLRGSQSGLQQRDYLAAPANTLLPELTDLQIERLAEAPFLLLSLRESDAGLWEQLSTGEVRCDLFAADEESDQTARRLIAATLAFLWQLAHRNPYAVRVLCGPTGQFCDCLTETTVHDVLSNALLADDLLRPRRAEDATFWLKLLGPGLSSEPAVRRAAHLAVLQSLLTGPADLQTPVLATAACRSRQPLRKL